jgi:hypothetical protein
MESAGAEQAKGLRRFVLPEYSRPFIQRLSAAAGKIALKDLRDKT